MKFGLFETYLTLVIVFSAFVIFGLASACWHPCWTPDLDGNGKVDIKDLALISHSFGATPKCGSTRFPYHEDWDFNGNGAIDICDVAQVANAFGTVI